LVTLVHIFHENTAFGITLYVIFGIGAILFMDVESDETEKKNGAKNK
jgi:hypothetical protein